MNNVSKFKTAEQLSQEQITDDLAELFCGFELADVIHPTPQSRSGSTSKEDSGPYVISRRFQNSQ